MKNMETNTQECMPEWILSRGGLDEEGFCMDFCAMHPLVYTEGQFFNYKGFVPEYLVRKQVFDYLRHYVKTNLGGKVQAIMECLRLYCMGEDLRFSETKVFCANGYYDLDTGFSDELDNCRYRLPVAYNPRAPKPAQWLAFLEELLEPEDILTLQEYLGYCLIPVTYGQRMLLIIGKGGEGKSRIGIVMQALMGQNMVNGSLAKLESNAFARADLQHRLLMVDDDLRLEGLKTTNYIKSIITAESPLDLERKGKQSYQAMLHCRLMAFGNGSLKSLHDRSYGFFRRQIILTTKDRRPDRVDDPYLAQYIRAEELEGVLLWAIEGLKRLVNNDLKFTLSRQARINLRNALSEGNNVLDFLRSQGYIRKDPLGTITSRSLYLAYRDWCEDNALSALSSTSFSGVVQQHAAEFGLVYSNHIDAGNGRKVRGFQGICRIS